MLFWGAGATAAGYLTYGLTVYPGARVYIRLGGTSRSPTSAPNLGEYLRRLRALQAPLLRARRAAARPRLPRAAGASRRRRRHNHHVLLHHAVRGEMPPRSRRGTAEIARRDRISASAQAVRIRMVECPEFAPSFVGAWGRFVREGGAASLYDGLIPLLVRQARPTASPARMPSSERLEVLRFIHARECTE